MPEEILGQMKPIGYVYSVGKALCAKHGTGTDPYVKSQKATPIYSGSITDTDLVCDVANCGVILAKNSTDRRSSNTRQTSVNNNSPQRKDKAMPQAADPQTPQQADQPRRRPSAKQLYGTFSASPIIFLVLGGVCGALALAGLCVEIRTSELLVYKSQDPTIMYVLYQPYYLVMGSQSLIEKMSWFYGYGVETVDLIFAFVLNHVTHALRQTNPKIAKFFGIASLVLVGLNCWSNVNCLPGLDPLIQTLVGLLLACAVVVFPVASLALIERGLAELGDD